MNINLVQKEPGIIIGPISAFLGFIIESIFQIVSSVSLANSLGVSIIFFTIVVRSLMLPLAFKQQKSMLGMQKLQPEMEKIRKKYSGNKDPEMQQKMNVEIQKLYTHHKVNPLSGCLPLVIQMPIFFALSYIMMNSHQFIGKVGEVYSGLANTLIEIGNNIGVEAYNAFMVPLALPKLPRGMQMDLFQPNDLERIMNRFTSTDWDILLSHIPEYTRAGIDILLEQKIQMEHFLGINLVDAPTVSFPNILIPILAALTTFVSSYFLMRQQAQTSTDPNVKMQQKVMIVVMPIFMGFTTFTLPSGVGLYWITSSVYQSFQQLALNKFYLADKKKEGA